MSPLPIAWDIREPPLAPAGALGSGGVARRLAAALKPGALSSLRMASSAQWLLVVGAPEDLPWVDGVRYLGRDDGLLMPTTRVPSVPAALLGAALSEKMPGQEFAVLERQVFAYSDLIADVDPRWLQDYARGAAT